jgi:aspartate/methionine/tyrosine aminotransferase
LTARTRLIVLASPSNPFGRIDTEDELRKLAALVPKEVTILSDEVYRDLAFADHAPPSIASYAHNTIVVSGLSKSCAMTGHRLGYLIADPGLVTAMWPVHQLVVTAASTLSQQLALEAFTDPQFLTASRGHYASLWQQARAALEAHGIPYIAPEGAFYVMCPVVPEHTDAFDFCRTFLEAHDVVTVPGSAFGPTGARFLRLSFASSPEVFQEASARLAKFLGR